MESLNKSAGLSVCELTLRPWGKSEGEEPSQSSVEGEKELKVNYSSAKSKGEPDMLTLAIFYWI